ncbi:NAD(P)-binding protein [Ganoderma leucocontextum]|nr:NAD(P)-binding protein [Ganoderma leucocontextum]
MAPVRNARVIFNEVPTDYPIPGKTVVYDESETIDLDNVPLNGGILVKVLALSIDPYLRRMMIGPDAENFIPTFKLGQPIVNYGIAVVARSENPAIKQGAHVVGLIDRQFPFQEYAIVHDLSTVRVVENSERLPWSLYLGVLGMPGQTAYYGWSEFARPKKGDVVFVSAASGSVGATVVQFAKAEGLKVIASAGSEEKVAFVKAIGADVAFNYKTTSTREVLEREGPINIYWDNVGGETLEAAIDFSARHTRVIVCGNISAYNTTEPYGVKNLQLLLWREITLHGFLFISLEPKYLEEFFKTIPKRIASGEIKYKEHIVRGLENAGQAILDVQMGKNLGKSVVVVADE